MKRVAYGLRELFSSARNGGSVRYIFSFLLVFAIGAGNAGRSSRTPAGQADQQAGHFQTSYALTVHPPSDLICAGREYRYTVEVEQRSVGTVDGDDVRFEEILQGIKITAQSENPSIAAVSPDSEVTGEALLANPAGMSPIEAEFTLNAEKAGTTSVQFGTTINGATRSFGAVLPVEVVNCKYKVKATSGWSFSAPNIYSHLVASTNGELQITPDSENVLKGTAKVDWDMSSFSAGCGHSHFIPQATAQLDGTLNEDGTLKVRVTFDRTDLSSVHCVGGESGQFAPPAIEITVPSTGGSQLVDHSFRLGEEDLHGSTVVHIIPAAAQ
jgi:hypothetical protein